MFSIFLIKNAPIKELMESKRQQTLVATAIMLSKPKRLCGNLCLLIPQKIHCATSPSKTTRQHNNNHQLLVVVFAEWSTDRDATKSLSAFHIRLSSIKKKMITNKKRIAIVSLVMASSVEVSCDQRRERIRSSFLSRLLC